MFRSIEFFNILFLALVFLKIKYSIFLKSILIYFYLWVNNIFLLSIYLIKKIRKVILKINFKYF